MEKECIADLSHRKNERGGILVYTVMSALFLFLAVGIGVDLSHLYLVKNELQNTADAAALAGASALSLPVANPHRIQTAVDRAVNVMNANKFNLNNKNYADHMSLAAQRDLVEFSNNLNGTYKKEGALTPTESLNVRFVKVKTPDVPVNFFFSIPMLGFQRNMDAEATAGLSVPGNANFCPGPLAVVDCGPNNPSCLGCPDKDGVQQPYAMTAVCNEGGPTPKPGPNGTTIACDPTKELCKNCVYTMRSPPSDGPAPGNYNGLCCPGENCGADEIKFRLAGGSTCKVCPPVNPGDEMTTTKPGQSHGGVKHGINTRFDIYNGGTNPTDHPPDPNVYGNKNNDSEFMTWKQYIDPDPNPFTKPKNPSEDDRRILILPITPISTWCDANGRDKVKVAGFASFFLQKKIPNGNGGEDGGDLKVEYIGDDVISAIGFDPNNTNTTNVVTWVLYR